MKINENLKKIRDSINETCIKCGRDTNSVKLVAVSKFHPYEKVLEAIDEGQLLFGENRVQEAKEKFEKVYQVCPNCDLHIIGSLQRNKVKDAVKICSCIESCDRLELIDEIEKQCSKIDKKMNVLLEIHTGEESKQGFLDLESVRNALKSISEKETSHIIPCGFMTMAPFTNDSELIRKSFKSVKNFQKILQEEFPMFNLSELSMGMSNDYKIAIEEGSTIVRIGTAIFGERVY